MSIFEYLKEFNIATITKGFYFNRTDLFENIVKIQESLGIDDVPTDTALGGYGNTDVNSPGINNNGGTTTTPLNPTDTTSVLARLLGLDTSIADIF